MKAMIRVMNCSALMLLLAVGANSSSTPVTWNAGDVFVAIGGGQYQVYSNAGVLKQTITDGVGSGATAGCAFDSLFNLYTTNFDNSEVFKFDATSHSVVQMINTIQTVTNTISTVHPESITFDASGNFYVGSADTIVNGKLTTGGGEVAKYNAAGLFPTLFAPATENRGTDWIELANDQKTLFYTSEGVLIKRFNVSSNAQLTDFATVVGGPALAIRLLPRFDSNGVMFLDGSGGLLVADSADIKQVDSSGNVVQSYGSTLGNNLQFDALALDPNGTSFWAGDFKTGQIARFSIATGVVEVGPISTGARKTLGGMCVNGEVALNIVPLTYACPNNIYPCSNVQNFAGFGNPNPGDPTFPNFHTWSARFDTLNSPFTLVVSATEGIDVSRFDEYFCNQAARGTSFGCTPPTIFTQTLKPITYADQVNASGVPIPGNAAVYRVENPPPATSFTGPLVYVAFHDPCTAVGSLAAPPCNATNAQVSYQPLMCPTSSGSAPTSNRRIFRDPSSAPPTDAALNHSFAFDFTTFVSNFSKLGDPISGKTCCNDFVIADRCPLVQGGNATFNSPFPKTNVKSGSVIPVKITVLDGNGNAVTNAVTFPNDITLSISLVNGPLELTFFNPGGSFSFFTPNGQSYAANLDTTGLSVGLTALCVTSINKTTNAGTSNSTGPGQFPPACELINITQ